MSLPTRRLQRWEGADVGAWQREWALPRLRVYDTIGSTSTLVLRLAARGAAAGTTAIAERQSAGRGRRGTPWLAPHRQALLLSTLVRAPGRRLGAGPASIRAGLIVADAIGAATGVITLIKWPNDLLADDGRKIAGILCEGALGNDGFLVVGIGINVLQQEQDLPPELRGAATSIALAGGATASRARLAGEILARVHAHADLTAPLAPAELDTIAQRDALRGRPLAIDGRHAGTGAGIAADGALLVAEEGEVRPYYSGSATVAGGATDERPERNRFAHTAQG